MSDVELFRSASEVMINLACFLSSIELAGSRALLGSNVQRYRSIRDVAVGDVVPGHNQLWKAM